MKGLWPILCLAVLLTGCASLPFGPSNEDWKQAEIRSGSVDAPDDLRPYYTVLYAEGPRNETLNWMKIGSRAIQIGSWPNARTAFDECIRHIESLQKGNPNAEEAKDTFTAEEIKPFKGEPYERVMVYLYRALIYYQEGDYSNCIAACKSGFLQDQSSEGQEYLADFQSLEFLTCLAWQKMGRPSDAADAWIRLRKLNDRLPEKMPEVGDRPLVVLQYGGAPIKIAFGNYGEKLGFQESSSSASAVGVPSGWIAPGDNLAYQATTRGGRQMDHVLGDKAVFKGATDAAGSVLVVGGAVAAMEGLKRKDDTTAIAGGAAVLAGIVSKALSASSNPRADTRAWNTLPAVIFLGLGPLNENTKEIEVEFLTNGGNGRVTKKIPVSKNPQGRWPSVVWSWN